MPFSILPPVLGFAFFLVWAFIGAMLLRDARVAAQHDADPNNNVLRFSAPRSKKPARLRAARLAS